MGKKAGEKGQSHHTACAFMKMPARNSVPFIRNRSNGRVFQMCTCHRLAGRKTQIKCKAGSSQDSSTCLCLVAVKVFGEGYLNAFRVKLLEQRAASPSVKELEAELNEG